MGVRPSAKHAVVFCVCRHHTAKISDIRLDGLKLCFGFPFPGQGICEVGFVVAETEAPRIHNAYMLSYVRVDNEKAGFRSRR